MPEPLLVYSEILPTNNDVTATVVFENEPEGEVTITNNNGKNSHVFDENGNFPFEFVDRAGNKGMVIANVNCIDKTAPTAEISYDLTELTNKNVVATLENMSEEVTITNNDGNSSYTFTENGSFTFEFVDRAGNLGKTTATVNWIDRRLPIARITYTPIELTNQDVVAEISFDKENVTVEGGNTHTFTENGEYTFEYMDKAGNSGMATASVDWIDKMGEDEIFTSNIYKKEGGYIFNIRAGITRADMEDIPCTTVKEFKENVETNQELIFMDKNGNEVDDEAIIATGMSIKVGNNNKYTLIVTGDIDGNGRLSIGDYARMKLHYIRLVELTRAELKAADINHDNNFSIIDMAKTKLVLIGLSENI